MVLVSRGRTETSGLTFHCNSRKKQTILTNNGIILNFINFLTWKLSFGRNNKYLILTPAYKWSLKKNRKCLTSFVSLLASHPFQLVCLCYTEPMNNAKTSFKFSTVLYENFMKLQRGRICCLGRSVFTTLKGITAKTAQPWASFPVR